MVTAVRLGALALGVSCAGLGAFGAYEFTHRLEGEVTYLVLAAPLIAVDGRAHSAHRRGDLAGRAPSQGPPLVGRTGPGRRRGFLLALPSASTTAKAGAQAERDALRGAMSRAEAALTKAEAELARREPMPTRPEARGSAVPIAGPSSQQRRQRKLTWKLRGGSFSLRRSRPRRTALFRRRCGCCQRRLTWSPSWRSGRAFRGP